MSTLMFRSRCALAIAAATVLTAAGCGDGDAGAPAQTPTTSAQEITAACPLVDLEVIARELQRGEPDGGRAGAAEDGAGYGILLRSQ